MMGSLQSPAHICEDGGIMGSNKLTWIKQVAKSRQTLAIMMLMILGVNSTLNLWQQNSGYLDLASRTTERVTLSNNVVVQVQWDSVRSNGREVYRVTGVTLAPGENGRTQSLADCGSSCAEVRRYIDQRIGFNTDIQVDNSLSAERRRELFTTALNRQFDLRSSSASARREGGDNAIDEARRRTFRANGETYKFSEVFTQDGRTYARVSPEGRTCTDCERTVAIPDSIRNNVQDILQIATDVVEGARTREVVRRDRDDRPDRDRDRDRDDTDRDRRIGDEMLENILRDCRREHGRNLADRTSSTASRRRVLRDDGDAEDFELGSAAVDELSCRSERFRDLISAENNNCSREERRDRTCRDNSRFITSQKATQFFTRNIEPHIVRGLVNSTSTAERSALFDMIHDLDSDVSSQFSNVLNRVTALSESTIRTSGNRVQERFVQAQRLATVNPMLAATMENLARQEQRVLMDSAFRLMNTHSSGLYAGMVNGNLTQQRAMGLFSDFQSRVSPITQCALTGMGNCGALGIGTNMNELANQFNLNTTQNRTLSDNVIGGRTSNLRQESVRSGVRSATGFQPVMPGQLTSYRGLTN